MAWIRQRVVSGMPTGPPARPITFQAYGPPVRRVMGHASTGPTGHSILRSLALGGGWFPACPPGLQPGLSHFGPPALRFAISFATHGPDQSGIPFVVHWRPQAKHPRAAGPQCHRPGNRPGMSPRPFPPRNVCALAEQAGECHAYRRHPPPRPPALKGIHPCIGPDLLKMGVTPIPQP